MDCWRSYPDELYLGGRKDKETGKAVCSAKTIGDDIQIKIEDENAFIAGYSAKELMQAIYACVKKIKGEEKDEPTA